MKSNVLNNDLNADYSFTYPVLNNIQIRQIKAGLFEQLLLFDKATITTNRVNFSLLFLINEIGLNNTEELIENGVINFLLWSPVLVTYGENKSEEKKNRSQRS